MRLKLPRILFPKLKYSIGKFSIISGLSGLLICIKLHNWKLISVAFMAEIVIIRIIKNRIILIKREKRIRVMNRNNRE